VTVIFSSVCNKLLSVV